MSVYLYEKRQRLDTLWKLLKERTPEQSISHKKMPSRKQHEFFVERHPYPWYFICSEENYDVIYGSVYLTNKREIGIQVFDKYKGEGIGTLALAKLREYHRGPFLANIAPGNEASIRFFEKHGFRHIQNTYASDR
jgi:RimJ/RimL family protein N-acetyltransferase